VKIIVNYNPVHRLSGSTIGPNHHEATHYNLADDGTLTVFNGALLCGRYSPDEYTGFTAGTDFHPNSKYPVRGS
jgi:hypothetical protein